MMVTHIVRCTGARDVARAGAPEGASAAGWELVFHKGQRQMSRPLAKAICAGELSTCVAHASETVHSVSKDCSCHV